MKHLGKILTLSLGAATIPVIDFVKDPFRGVNGRANEALNQYAEQTHTKVGIIIKEHGNCELSQLDMPKICETLQIPTNTLAYQLTPQNPFHYVSPNVVREDVLCALGYVLEQEQIGYIPEQEQNN